jgi:putative spermidine/putrescine transport system substrate-binding protein
MEREFDRRAFLGMAAATGLVIMGCGDEPSTKSAAKPGGNPLAGSGSVKVSDGGGTFSRAQRIAHWEPFTRDTGIEVVPTPGFILEDVVNIRRDRPKVDVADAGPQFDELVPGKMLNLDYSLWKPGNREAFKPAEALAISAPYFFGSSNITYDKQKFGANPPKTWADVWDVEKYPGKRALYPGTYGDGMVEIALLADGVAPENIYPIDFDRYFKSMDRIRPHIVRFGESGGDVARLINDGEAVMGTEYSARYAVAVDEGAANVGQTFDQGWAFVGYYSVFKGADNVENAMKFIAYVGQPEVQAKFSEILPYAPPNTLAFKYLSEGRQKLMPTAPENRDKIVYRPDMLAYWGKKDAATGKTPLEELTARWEEWIAKG